MALSPRFGLWPLGGLCSWLRIVTFWPVGLSVIVLCVGSFSTVNQKHVNHFAFPEDFIDHTGVADSCSIGVCESFELLNVVVFGWDRVFSED